MENGPCEGSRDPSKEKVTVLSQKFYKEMKQYKMHL